MKFHLWCEIDLTHVQNCAILIYNGYCFSVIKTLGTRENMIVRREIVSCFMCNFITSYLNALAKAGRPVFLHGVLNFIFADCAVGVELESKVIPFLGGYNE